MKNNLKLKLSHCRHHIFKLYYFDVKIVGFWELKHKIAYYENYICCLREEIDYHEKTN